MQGVFLIGMLLALATPVLAMPALTDDLLGPPTALPPSPLDFLPDVEWPLGDTCFGSVRPDVSLTTCPSEIPQNMGLAPDANFTEPDAAPETQASPAPVELVANRTPEAIIWAADSDSPPLGTEPTPPGKIPDPVKPAMPDSKPEQLAVASVDQGIGWPTVAAAVVVLVPTALLYKLASLIALRRRSRHDSPVERSVLEAIRVAPGIRHSELRRRVAKGNGTIEHYLRRLLAAGSIVCIRSPRCTRYFARDAVIPGLPAGIPPKDSKLWHLLSILARQETDLSSLAIRAKMAISTTHYNVGKLIETGLVVANQSGRSRKLMATEAGRAAVSSFPNQS